MKDRTKEVGELLVKGIKKGIEETSKEFQKDEIKEILDNINNKWEDYKEKTKRLKYVQDIISGNDFKQLLDYITNLQDRIKELEQINEEHRKLNGELREENKELKMTNLALADDITKNKIIKQEALTECCGIPIGEIPMLKIQNDDYKTRNEKAINCINHYATENDDYSKLYSTEEEELLEILQGKSDE